MHPGREPFKEGVHLLVGQLAARDIPEWVPLGPEENRFTPATFLPLGVVSPGVVDDVEEFAVVGFRGQGSFLSVGGLARHVGPASWFGQGRKIPYR
jgi:hypothetical protein